MKRILGVLVLLAAANLCASDAQQAAPRKQVEVCFVVDTTGSMSGLIEGAKAKVWSIANAIVTGPDKPKLKMALVPYRDRGDKYVTKIFDLTDDLDTVYKNLMEFQADGGGDGPESVNQALNEAVCRITWNADKKVSKIIFLVGDAPPHMDYADDVKYPETCKLAVTKDLIINTIQCGSMEGTAGIWQEIAKKSEGSYVPLVQSGNMVAISTPMDAKLAELNVEVGKTLIAWGKQEERREVAAKQAASEAAPAAASADRLHYNASTGKSVQGNHELVDDLRDGKVKLDAVNVEDLPEPMKKMSADERKVYVEEQDKRRAGLQKEIAELAKKRQEYIADEQKKAAGAKPADSFDAKVSEIVKEQAARKK